MSDAFTPYQRRLFVFLSVASFFEGYDFLALSQILPNIQKEWDLSDAALGTVVMVINIGTVVAYLLVRGADRWGRRRVLTVTILGYTTFTALTGFATNVWMFCAVQLVARVFLIGEWATAMVIAAEEFPARRRGMAIGVIGGCSSLGAIMCAGTVPLLVRADWGWRTVYFVGVLPLLILAYMRRDLRETRRFTEQVGEIRVRRSLFHILGTPHRKRLLQMALIWFVAYIGTNTAVTFWKKFAVAERNMSEGEVGLAISIAAVAGMPLVFLAAKLVDSAGRRMSAVAIFGLGALGTIGCYTLHGFVPLTAALVLGILGSSAMPHVLNAYTTELFPTDLRGDAYAWSNNLAGRLGYVFSPAVVAIAAERVGWGRAVSSTAIFSLIALALVLWLLPETRGRELEETAALGGAE